MRRPEQLERIKNNELSIEDPGRGCNVLLDRVFVIVSGEEEINEDLLPASQYTQVLGLPS